MKQPPGSSNLVASFPVQLLTAGTSACIADLATFPLDTAKVRLQVIICTRINGQKQRVNVINHSDPCVELLYKYATFDFV